MANEVAPASNQAIPSSPEPVSGEFTSTDSKYIPSGKFTIPGVMQKNKLLLLGVASGLVLLGFIWLLLWVAEPPFRPILSGISEKEAASIIELLQKEKIPYKLEGASTVLVPADQVYALRLKLAGEDLIPGKGNGFELFDSGSQFGVSDFVQKINLQRAMQGELARTIEVLPMVTAARVHLVMPKESPFIKQQRETSASVMLQLGGGGRLPKSSVLAIQNLVSAAVPNLERDAVTIVDSSGNLLSSSEEDTGMDAGQTQQEYQTNLERRLEDRLTGMLEQVVGAGHAIVRVTANINREHVEQQNQRYNPDEMVLRSEQSVDERSAARDAQAKGIPGVASNTPGKEDKQTGQPREESVHSESIKNYEISSISEKRTIPFGEINRLSVAVIVGGSFKEENGESVFVPKSQAELASIQKLVEGAMGFNEDRGDTVEVQSMALIDISSSEDLEALKGAEDKAFYLKLTRYVVAGLALLLLAWFVLRPLSRQLTAKNPTPENTSPGVQAAAPGASTPALPASAEHIDLYNTARELVLEDTDMATRIIRQWTYES
ncbi:MAG: flagellar basal-body MS-ring/collar protein FliF [Mariprofundaceae bacterium]